MFTKPIKLFLICSTTFVIFLIIVIFYLLNQSIPDYNKLVVNSLVTQDVKVFRNKYAIPNIIGQTNEDTFFALGYVHAQDRLWQIILLRKMAKGKLAEIFGEKYIEIDKLVRTLGIYNNSKKSVKSLSKKTVNLLKSYSNGINKRLIDIQKEGLGRGSPILFMFSPKISPWTPADSMAILKLYDLLNNESAKNEIIRLNLLKVGVPYKRLLDLYPAIPKIQNSELLRYKNLFSEITTNSYKNNFVQNKLNIGNTSNMWAALGSRTATGNSLVGLNLHTNFGVPIIWMLARLELETGPVVGATIPGIPIILAGRTKFFSWGISNSKIDNQDLTIEVLNHKNKNEYKTKDGFKKFKTKDVLINIKGKPGITHKILFSENGPILPTSAYGIDSIKSENLAFAIEWTGLNENDQSIETFINIMLSKNIEEAKKSIKFLVVPTLNILFVDNNKAEIISSGKIPIRHESKISNYGIIPSLGNFGSKNWLGNFDFSKNANIKIFNNGIIFNTNNKILNKKFPLHHSYEWSNNQRFFRMQNLFAKRQYHTLQSFKEIQIDNISSSARTLIPLLAKDLWYSQVLDFDNEYLNLRKSALDLLAEWNGEMSIYLPQPLIYHNWAAEFQRMVLKDEIGNNIIWFKSINADFLERILRNIDGASEWCDIKLTNKIETCEELSLRSLDNALINIKNQYGQDIKKWLWGNFHKAYFVDNFLEHYPLISNFTNLIFEVPGGDNTLYMSRSNNSLDNKFNVNYGSSLRIVIDFSNENESYFSIPTGQSSHFLSKNYDDFVDLWQRNQYVKIPFSVENITNEHKYMMLITNSAN